MTDAQIRTWQATLENRYFEGQVTDVDVNQLLEELVELRGRITRLETGNTLDNQVGRNDGQWVLEEGQLNPGRAVYNWRVEERRGNR